MLKHLLYIICVSFFIYIGNQRVFLLLEIRKTLDLREFRMTNILTIIKYNIFRDNGIVISISVVQCSVEFILMITCSFYIYILNGYSKTFDKFFNIYLLIVTVIILPTFYLNGEAAFRRNLVAYGPFRALKNAIVGKL